MVQIPEQAAVGFGRRAGEYERGRPGYPEAAIELLARELPLGAGRRLLDLAAGTGKLTRMLVATGAEVLAVEPVAEMRAQLERVVPQVRALEGTAEAIPLADGALDAVTVAQAFHWFDAERALPEIRRVLAPGGALALVWNWWDRDSAPWVPELLELLEPYVERTPHRSSAWRERLAASPLFAPPERHEVPNPQAVERESLV